MTERIYQRVLEVAPNEKGAGMSMTLFWDGAEGARAEGEFQGLASTTELSPKRLLADVRELTKEACDGDLQIVARDEALIAKLEEYVGVD